MPYSPEPEQIDSVLKFMFSVGSHLKAYSIPIAIGLAVLLWKLLQWMGLGWIAKVKTLEERSRDYVTNDDLNKCRSELGHSLDRLHDDINRIYDKIDDLRNDTRK